MDTAMKEQQETEQQPVRDVEWWERRAKYFESQYKRERARRKKLQQIIRSE